MCRAFTLALTLLLYGCAKPADLATSIDSAKAILEPALAYNSEIQYRDIVQYPGNVVCGEVNAMSRWGDGAGFKRFIVRADKADTEPSGGDWDIFCSEDPAARLQARLGIGPLNQQNTGLLAVQQHLRELDGALREYFVDHQAFPTTAQGLAALLTRKTGATGSSAGNTAEGYMASIPEDPWGRPYVYEKPRQLHGDVKIYRLYTLGRDGLEGGQGQDADIGNWQLKYLEHLAKL